MMNQEQSDVDSICIYPSCGSQNSILFKWDQQNIHVKQHKKYGKAIHQSYLQNIFALDDIAPSKIMEMQEKSISQIVQEAKMTFSQKLFQYICQKQLEPNIKSIIEKARNKQIISSKNVIYRLKNGDNSLACRVKQYEQSQKTLPFPNYLNIIQVQSQIKSQFQKIWSKITNSLNVQNQQSLPNPGYENSNKKDSKQCYPASEKVSFTQIYQQIKPQINQSIVEKDLSIKLMKTKKISKEKKPQPKNISSSFNKKTVDNQNIILQNYFVPIQNQQQNKILEQKELIPKKQIKFQNELELLSQYQIIIHKCASPQQLMNYILKTYKQLKIFHIFSTAFTVQSNIIIIFENYKLKGITFNCNYLFSSLLFSQIIPQYQLKDLQFLQLKWGIDRFFNRYQMFYSFPQKKIEEIQCKKCTQFAVSRWNKMPKNETIWLHSNDHIRQFTKQPHSLTQIKTLHLATGAQKYFIQLTNINRINTIKNLVNLNLHSVQIKGKQFKMLIRNNSKLKTIIINQCQFQSNTINQALGVLKQLHYLSNFSLFKRDQQLKIDPQVITSLLHLQSLNLNEITFDLESNDEQDLQHFADLKRLKYLSLYKCSPIGSKLLAYFYQQMLSNLIFLNVGETQVNSSCKPQLIMMKNLQYLNLDSLQNFSVRDLLFVLKKQQQQYKRKSPLRYLSLEQADDKKNWSLKDITDLSKFLPNLQYIDISGCKYVNNYQFQSFKKLKTITLDKKLNSKIAVKTANIERYLF